MDRTMTVVGRELLTLADAATETRYRDIRILKKTLSRAEIPTVGTGSAAGSWR
jgi:hypothetical protein